jgi:hypothetical protein
VDNRNQVRMDILQQVSLSLLGAPDSSKLPATLTNISGRGMRLLIHQSIPANAPVKVDFRLHDDDALLLGEVVYCHQEALGSFAVGLELQHSLLHLTSLHNLVARLLGDAERVSPVQSSGC